MSILPKFQFIAEALNANGGFAPQASAKLLADSEAVLNTHLIRYPRETVAKFNRRNENVHYRNFMLSACNRFTGFLFSKSASRQLSGLYQTMTDDIDRQGNHINQFWQVFAVNAKARGSMLVLIDMPQQLPDNRADQINNRVLPYFNMIEPEWIQDYVLDDEGRFDWVALPIRYQNKPAWKVWTSTEWRIQEPRKDGAVYEQAEHGLGINPVLIFTESDLFPCYGEFSQIAELTKAWFNRTSERDEQLRGQTFNVFTYQLGDLETAETVASTLNIGVNNALLYKGERPGFIAPEASCLQNYAEVILALEEAIKEIGHHIEMTAQQEAAAALNLRMKNLSSSLSLFAQRLADFERNCWDVAARWLNQTQVPLITWPINYDIADVGQELSILQQMQAAGFADSVIREQQKRIIQIQFNGLDNDEIDTLIQDTESAKMEIQTNDPNLA
jgi:hypothetical protein